MACIIFYSKLALQMNTEYHTRGVTVHEKKVINAKRLKRNKSANGQDPSNKQYLVSGYVMSNS